MAKFETATFAAGCFWGVEEIYRTTNGVKETVVGYIGGHTETPTYEDVCSGETGHAEAVQVTFDPKQITYTKLLEMFWSLHDPTQFNRQGPDVGSEYRSAIFYHSETQRESAQQSKKEIEKKLGKKVVTEIAPATKFWKAEEYHQNFLMKHGKNLC